MPIILEPIPPSDYPVTWAQAKVHLRLDDADNSANATYVTSLIAAATRYAEDALGMSLMEQTRVVSFNAEDMTLAAPARETGAGAIASASAGFGARSPVLRLKYGPVTAVNDVVDGERNAFTGYTLETTPNGDRLRFTTAPPAFPIEVEYVAGHATADEVPADIRLALLALVGTYYENRESVSDKSKMPVPHFVADFFRLKSRRLGVA